MTQHRSMANKTQDEVNAEWAAHAASWDNDDTRAYASGVQSLLFDPSSIGLTKEGVKSLRVLDFGCGTGLLADLLRGDVGEIVCLDAAKEMVDVVAGKVEKGPWPNVKAVHCVVDGDTARELAKTVPPFDLVIASSSLTFVPDLPSTLSAVREHFMKPGAQLVHFDWKGEGEDYHDGFNEASATRIHEGAGLEVVKLIPSLEVAAGMEIFVGVAKKPA